MKKEIYKCETCKKVYDIKNDRKTLPVIITCPYCGGSLFLEYEQVING